MSVKICLLFILSLFALHAHSKPNDYLLSSPNGALQIGLSNKNKTCSISSVSYSGNIIVRQSALGLLVNKTDFTKNVSFSGFAKKEYNETWTTVVGKQPEVRNHYNEYKLKIAKADASHLFYEIVFRVYDDGFAYRYLFSSDTPDSLLIERELTQLNFMNDFTYWAYNGENHNLGPINKSKEKREQVGIPFVMQLHKTLFMAIHEAGIQDFAPFSINAAMNGFALGFNVDYSTRKQPFNTAWRTFIVGKRVGDLTESNLIENLNEPCKIEDPSWIKPGKTMWDWRVWGYKTADGYEYTTNTQSHKRFIDFASENNIQYLMIDADWYGAEFSEESDPTTARTGIDIEECMKYAFDRGIDVILYLNDVGAKKFGLEKTLKQFSEWGAVGVKYGFMQGTLEEKVKHTRYVVELCARYKLMITFHDDPIPPSGDHRTYPNLITTEYCHAQVDARKSYYPETAVNHPLINMIAGPLDVNNGWFDLNNAHTRVKVYEEIPGTVVAEVAKLITIYTGWAVLPDSPEEYKKKYDLFECIKNMPAHFDNFKVLDAKLDNYVSVVRKAKDDWFIGSLTNRDKRSITLDLSFLPKDKKYEAVLYEDHKDSHFLKNKESYTIRRQLVDHTTKLIANMGPGGGHAVHIKLLP